jgi:hypothetical protein
LVVGSKGNAMKIIFSPIRSDETLTVEKQGESLVLNGETIDLSFVQENQVFEPGEFPHEKIVGLARKNGKLEVILLAPHGINASEEARFPKPILNASDGLIDLPK